MKKGSTLGLVDKNLLHDLCCHFSAIRANLMMDVSLKMETANPACQMAANVITTATAQSQQPILLCLQSYLSEPVRGDASPF